MDTIEAVYGRRSIRNFQEKQVEEDVLKKIIEAARWAPSGGNKQPWSFVIVRDPRRLKLIKSVSTGLRDNPPIIIVACLVKEKNPKSIQNADYLSLGASIENMLLVAHSLGLGTCWVVSTNWSGISSAIGLTETSKMEPISLISLGYPVEEPLSIRQRKPVSEIAYIDTINNRWSIQDE